MIALHRLVRCKVAFTFRLLPKRKGPQTKKLQVYKLRDPRVKNNLQDMLEERLQCVTAAEPEEQWKQMKTKLQETTAEVAGLSTRKKKEKKKDWFEEAGKEIQELPRFPGGNRNIVGYKTQAFDFFSEKIATGALQLQALQQPF